MLKSYQNKIQHYENRLKKIQDDTAYFKANAKKDPSCTKLNYLEFAKKYEKWAEVDESNAKRHEEEIQKLQQDLKLAFERGYFGDYLKIELEIQEYKAEAQLRKQMAVKYRHRASIMRKMSDT